MFGLERMERGREMVLDLCILLEGKGLACLQGNGVCGTGLIWLGLACLIRHP